VHATRTTTSSKHVTDDSTQCRLINITPHHAAMSSESPTVLGGFQNYATSATKLHYGPLKVDIHLCRTCRNVVATVPNRMSSINLPCLLCTYAHGIKQCAAELVRVTDITYCWKLCVILVSHTSHAVTLFLQT